MPAPFNKGEKRNFISAEAAEEHQDRFLKKVHEYELKMGKEKKPFCRTCAVLEFRDKNDLARKEYERKYGEYTGEELNVDINLESFYGEKNFESLPERSITVKENMHLPPQTTVFKEYKCKRYSHGVSINMQGYTQP